MNTPRALLLVPLLLAPLAACNQVASNPPPQACTADFTFPVLTLSLAKEPSGTYVVTAPANVQATSEGRYGSSSCPEFLSSVKLLVNGAEVASASRTVTTGQTPPPFLLTWTVQPGKNGVPASGETTLQLRLQGTGKNGESVQSNLVPVRVVVP